MIAAFFFDPDDEKVRNYYGYQVEKLVFETGVLQASGERLVVRGGDVLLHDGHGGDLYARIQEVLGGPPLETGRLDHGELLTEWAYQVALESVLFAIVIHGISQETTEALEERLLQHSAYRGLKQVHPYYLPHVEHLLHQMEDRYFVEGASVLVPKGRSRSGERELPAHRVATLKGWGFTSVGVADRPFKEYLGGDFLGSPMLRRLVDGGCLEDLKRAFLTGISTELRDPRGRTLLGYAAERSDVATVQVLVEAGADLEARDGDGRTPLFHATQADAPENFDYLVAAGADLEARDDLGWTPLIATAHEGWDDPLQALIAAGADLEAADEAGETALFWAARLEDPTNLQVLLAAGANLSATNGEGRTPLFIACLTPGPDAARTLLEAGADAAARDATGATPLFIAAASGEPETAGLLLRSGADLEARDDHGATALIAGARTGMSDTLKVLIDAGADLEAKDEAGETPLLAACAAGQANNAFLLLQSGAERGAKDAAGNSALALLEQRGLANTFAVDQREDLEPLRAALA